MDANAMVTAMGDYSFTDLSSTRSFDLLNHAYHRVNGMYDWPYLEKQADISAATNAAGAWTAQPADLWTVQSMVNITTGLPLTPIRADTLEKSLSNSLAQTGSAYCYFFIGQVVYLYPIPGVSNTEIIRLRYITDPPDVTVGSPNFLIPARHSRVVLLGALAEAYTLEDEPDTGQLFESKFINYVNAMADDLLTTQTDRPDVVVDIMEDYF